ncbi:response regulator transcription factor [Curvivirga sp.]|uniref:response regulator transcription factor n=1 Tax=Curvivirga sp. TaxID=2856848 RepID=UPI003B58F9FC
MQVLLVEDNMDLAESINDYLTLKGCTCDCAFNGKAGLEFATNSEYDICIFDVSMPMMDGLELCHHLREKCAKQTPVLFLTARDTVDDKMAGFAVGADDYMVKPFELRELYARIEAIHKRAICTSRLLQIKDLTVNTQTGEVHRQNNEIILSSNMYQLLIALMQRSPKLVSRQKLEYLVWGDDLPDSDSLRTHIYKLRQLIDKPYQEPLIQTIKGRGYRMS